MRRHYLFTGRVQAVGFRWRARTAAERYGVTGFVRNLYDGSVEMEAEGPEEAIDMLIQSLRCDRYIRIDSMEMKEIPVQGDLYFRTR